MSDEYEKDLDPAFLEKLDSISDADAEARAKSLRAVLEGTFGKSLKSALWRGKLRSHARR